MRPFRIAPLVIAACLAAAPVSASPVLIDFDSLQEGDLVTGQFDGVTFSGAMVYTSGAIGGSLNEFELPPHSDFNAIVDTGSEIEATFATGATSVGAFITYSEIVTMTAYNGSVVLGSVTSQFSSNLGLSGDLGSTPNEVFLFTSLTPITRVTFTGNPAGGSFVLDDFSADLLDASPTPVPEPATATLVVLGGAALLFIRNRKTRTGRRA